MMLPRRPLLAAILSGGLVGGVAAVAIPSAESTPRDAPFRAQRDAIHSAPARQRERGPVTNSSIYLRAHRGTIRIEARLADPAGGPDWAIRAFEADRMIPPAIRRPNSDGVISVGLCAQLGRIVGGQFGWVDGDGAFRRVSTAAYTGTPAVCGSRKLANRGEPILERAVLLDRPASSNPLVRGSVVWGLSGGSARSVQISTRGRIAQPRPSGPHGAYLAFFGPNLAVNDATLRVRFAHGPRYRSAQRGAAPRPHAPRGYTPDATDAVLPSTAQVVARTFDPAGGPSWGLTAFRTRLGLWCVGFYGSLIDGHVGDVDRRLGLLVEQRSDTGPNGCGRRAQPTRERPLQLGYGGGSYLEPMPELAPYARQLRLQHGRTVYWGRALPEVERITMATPRDVRTIVPTGPAHAFLVVYDGEFSSGTTTITAHFKDGRTWTDRQTNVNF
jgi:hypothetical protein